MKKRKAVIDQKDCVACGTCMKVCPRQAITIPHGVFAVVEMERCVGCGLCSRECPASIIEIKEVAQ